MRTIHYIFVLLFLACGTCFSAQGQKKKPSFDRKITIEREYQPVILDVKKMNREPNVVEQKDLIIKPEYTLNFSKPVPIEQSILYLSPEALSLDETKEREGFLRLGFGSGVNSLADFTLPMIKKKNTKMDFVLNHYALWGGKEHAKTKAALNFTQKNEFFKIFAGINGAYDTFNYYGDRFKSDLSIIEFKDVENDAFEPLRGASLYPGVGALGSLVYLNALKRAGAHVGVSNRMDSEEGISYKVQADYGFFAAKFLQEQQIKLSSNFELSFMAGRVGVDLDFTSLLHSSSHKELDGLLKNFHAFSVKPYYLLSRESWDLRLGLDAYLTFGTKAPIPIPDVRFEYRVVPQYLALYVGAKGEYQINSFDKIYSENVFFAPGLAVQNLEVPVRLYGGAKISPAYGLLLDLFADYRQMDNQYFFVNQEFRRENPMSSSWGDADRALYLNMFEVLYSRANLLKVGGKVSYNYHDRFNFSLYSVYNHWSVADFDNAMHFPKIEVDFNAGFRVNSSIAVHANFHSTALRSAKVGEEYVDLEPKIDLNLGANYDVEEWLSLFVRVNNLTNTKYQEWYGYKVDGFNVMLGMFVSF